MKTIFLLQTRAGRTIAVVLKARTTKFRNEKAIHDQDLRAHMD